ncbi:MAG: PQQ-binding-like beta-propeller repeat protein [Pirellulales bacterium]
MLCRTNVGRVLGAALIALGWIAWTSDALAQPQNDMGGGVVFRPAPRELTLRLTRARKAIESEDYNEAVLELGRLLAEIEQGGAERLAPDENAGDEQQDYFVGPRGEGTHVSLKSEAQRLIGSMPAKGREWYELQYGPEARKLLEEAADKGDVGLLTNVSRRYFHTKAGYEATLLLGRYHMDNGSPLAAALCFRRLAESPAANEYEPELSVLIASCWLHSNAPDRAQQTLAALVKKLPSAKLRIGGSEITLPRDETRAREQLETLLALRRLQRGGPLLEWTLFRGDATRTAQVVGDAPLATARWRLPTANDPNDEQLVEQVAKRYIAQGIPALPSMQPLAVQDSVLMRTTDGVWGVDMRTGKRKWPFPWVEMEASSQSLNARNLPPGAGAAAREAELRQRLYEDVPYGQMSSDGESLYLLDSLGFASQAAMVQGPFIAIRPGTRGVVSANQLVALDVRREGKLLWMIGDGQGGGGDEPRLAGAFFLGAPLPLQGKLYVMAEINSEVRLVVLDPKTGALEWQQQLAQLESRGIQQDLTRRLAGASPSYADGVLICPTSAGAVVAVDIATRTLLWGFQYNQSSGAENRPNQPFFNRGLMGNPPKPIGQRWVDATATIHAGKVLVTPVESEEMYCLDLLTGKLLWPAQKRNDLAYVAAVTANQAILVGKNHVVSVDLETGKPTWPNPIELPDGGMPSGRGFHSGNDYYLPTTNQWLLRIDLQKGAIAQRIRTDRNLGNLICFRDEIISHGPDGMSVYPMVRPLRERVAALLKQNPDDSWALARTAELAAYDGERERALEILRRACQLHPQDESLRILLVSNLTAALREDFPKFRGLAGELERLVDDPVQREQFLRLMAAGLRQVGEGEAAFQMLLKLVDMEVARGADSPSAMEEVTPTHSVRRDRWVAGQLASLYRDALPEQKRRIDELLTQRQTAAERSGQIWSLRQYLRNFGFHAQSASLRLQLADRLIDSDAAVEALTLLAQLETHSDRAIAAQAVAVTARALAHARQPEMAASYYLRLESDFGDVVFPDGRTGAALAAAAVGKDVNLKRFWDSNRAGWAYGRVKVEEAENVNLNRASYGRTNPVTIRELSGAIPFGFQIVYDQQKNYSLVGKDGAGRELFAASLLRSDGGFTNYYLSPPQAAHAKSLGQIVFVHMGMEVVAINSLRTTGRADDVMRWRTDVVQRIGDNDQSARTRLRMTSMSWGGMRATVTDNNDRVITGLGPCVATGVVFQKQREIVCVDPLRGEVLWSRNDLPMSSELSGDEELLFVTPADGKEMLVLDMIDGRTLAARPLDVNETRWATSGRRILAWSERKDAPEKTLRLFDAWTGKSLYEQTFASTARGAVVDDRWLATCQPDGRIAIVSLADGQTVARTEGEAESQQLLNIQLFVGRDNFLVATNGPPRGNATQVEPITAAPSNPLTSGRVYSFDRRTGKVRWPVPVNYEQFVLLTDQPADSPLMVFMRRRSGNQSSLLCLDRRDGRVVFFRDEVPVQANFYEIAVQQDQSQVVVLMGAKSFTFKFTDEAMPPEPPAQLGSAASQLPGGDRSTGGLLNSIFGAFGKGAKARSAAPDPAVPPVPGPAPKP